MDDQLRPSDPSFQSFLPADDMSTDEKSRYQRQTILASVGQEGQLRLKKSRVLVVGVGGLGSPCALYLAGAGVGKLGLVDPDLVSLSNLHRQILYRTNECREKKAIVAAKHLSALNPLIEIEPYTVRIDDRNANELIKDYDVIVDGTDSFKSRQIISRACVELKKPHVYAGIFQYEGQLALFDPETGPCYRCLFQNSPESSQVPNCSDAGVLGPLAGMMGSMQAFATLKYLLKVGSQVGSNRSTGVTQLFVFDGLTFETRHLTVHKREECRGCGSNRELHTVASVAESFQESIEDKYYRRLEAGQPGTKFLHLD